MAQIPVKTTSSMLNVRQLTLPRVESSGYYDAIRGVGQALTAVGNYVDQKRGQAKAIDDYKTLTDADLGLMSDINDIKTRFVSDGAKDINAYDAEMGQRIEERAGAITDPQTRLQFIYKAKVNQLNTKMDFAAQKQKADIRQAQNNYQVGWEGFETLYQTTSTPAERAMIAEQQRGLVNQAFAANLITAEQYRRDTKHLNEGIGVDAAIYDVNVKPLDVVLSDIANGVYAIPVTERGKAMVKVQKTAEDLSTAMDYKQKVQWSEVDNSVVEKALSITDVREAQEYIVELERGVLLQRIDPKTVASAKRYLSSMKAMTNQRGKDVNEKFGDMLFSMQVIRQDFVENKDHKKLLKDVNEYRSRVLELGATGQLSKEQVSQLNRRMQTLVDKPEATALARLEGDLFARANARFTQELPLEVRGRAQAQWYYETKDVFDEEKSFMQKAKDFFMAGLPVAMSPIIAAQEELDSKRNRTRFDGIVDEIIQKYQYADLESVKAGYDSQLEEVRSMALSKGYSTEEAEMIIGRINAGDSTPAEIKARLK